jgi:hypothetical protein
MIILKCVSMAQWTQSAMKNRRDRIWLYINYKLNNLYVKEIRSEEDYCLLECYNL